MVLKGEKSLKTAGPLALMELELCLIYDIFIFVIYYDLPSHLISKWCPLTNYLSTVCKQEQRESDTVLDTITSV